MIQALLRTDGKSSGRVSTANESGTTDSTTVSVRQPLRVRPEIRARRVRGMALVVTLWATPDDGRFVALAAGAGSPVHLTNWAPP